jgi:hypothetical protein
VDDAVAVTAVGPGRVVDGLDAGQEQRREQHVEPDRGEHQRPQRHRLLGRLDRGGEPEVTRDHRDRHGMSLASSTPTRAVNRIVPRMNDMRAFLK